MSLYFHSWYKLLLQYKFLLLSDCWICLIYQVFKFCSLFHLHFLYSLSFLNIILILLSHLSSLFFFPLLSTIVWLPIHFWQHDLYHSSHLSSLAWSFFFNILKYLFCFQLFSYLYNLRAYILLFILDSTHDSYPYLSTGL